VLRSPRAQDQDRVETPEGDVRLLSEEARDELLQDEEIRRLAVKWTRSTGRARGCLILLDGGGCVFDLSET
jgi:hypothetical protein